MPEKFNNAQELQGHAEGQRELTDEELEDVSGGFGGFSSTIDSLSLPPEYEQFLFPGGKYEGVQA
jgi:hypothetical protein